MRRQALVIMAVLLFSEALIAVEEKDAPSLSPSTTQPRENDITDPLVIAENNLKGCGEELDALKKKLEERKKGVELVVNTITNGSKESLFDGGILEHLQRAREQGYASLRELSEKIKKKEEDYLNYTTILQIVQEDQANAQARRSDPAQPIQSNSVETFIPHLLPEYEGLGKEGLRKIEELYRAFQERNNDWLLTLANTEGSVKALEVMTELPLAQSHYFSSISSLNQLEYDFLRMNAVRVTLEDGQTVAWTPYQLQAAHLGGYSGVESDIAKNRTTQGFWKPWARDLVKYSTGKTLTPDLSPFPTTVYFKPFYLLTLESGEQAQNLIDYMKYMSIGQILSGKNDEGANSRSYKFFQGNTNFMTGTNKPLLKKELRKKFESMVRNTPVPLITHT